MRMVKFSDIEVGATFWEKLGRGEWFPTVKVDEQHARCKTNDGLIYGEPFVPQEQTLFKLLD